MSELLNEALATFRDLLDEARASADPEPTAMALATATPDGRPSVRTVLLKGVDPAGFVFFTNYDSRKGGQLEANPQAALLFHWRHIRHQVQVKVEGRIERVAAAESDAYFATRPRMSQIGAWASLQSQELDARATFEARIADYDREFAGGEVPRPPHWGGYRVLPEFVEFWQGRLGRTHDRLCYRRGCSSWDIERLEP